MSKPHSALATLRHVSMSGRSLDNFWEFDPKRGVIILRVALGSAAALDLDVLVCSPRNFRRFAWLLFRSGEAEWRLSAACYGESLREIAKATPLHSDLPAGSFDLIGAPPKVQTELEAL